MRPILGDGCRKAKILRKTQVIIKLKGKCEPTTVQRILLKSDNSSLGVSIVRSKRQPYKTFTKEFKLEAVRLMSQSDKLSS